MPTVKDLEKLNAAGETHFGYVDVDSLRCPPFVMFTNGLDCPVCAKIIIGGSFEKLALTLWCGLAASASAVIDIGAQGGIFSLAAASLRRDLPIHAFEPNPDGFARLLVNRHANTFENITPYRTALADRAAVVPFRWNTKWIGHISSGGSVASAAGLANTVTTYTAIAPLDEVLQPAKLGGRPLIKIDVEGFEGVVFRGMRKTLDLKPDIILECFDPNVCDAITDIVAPQHYNFFFIDEDNGRVERRDRLYPADPYSRNMNQLMTIHDISAVSALI